MHVCPFCSFPFPHTMVSCDCGHTLLSGVLYSRLCATEKPSDVDRFVLIAIDYDGVLVSMSARLVPIAVCPCVYASPCNAAESCKWKGLAARGTPLELVVKDNHSPTQTCGGFRRAMEGSYGHCACGRI